MEDMITKYINFYKNNGIDELYQEEFSIINIFLLDNMINYMETIIFDEEKNNINTVRKYLCSKLCKNLKDKSEEEIVDIVNSFYNEAERPESEIITMIFAYSMEALTKIRSIDIRKILSEYIDLKKKNNYEKNIYEEETIEIPKYKTSTIFEDVANSLINKNKIKYTEINNVIEDHFRKSKPLLPEDFKDNCGEVTYQYYFINLLNSAKNMGEAVFSEVCNSDEVKDAMEVLLTQRRNETGKGSR